MVCQKGQQSCNQQGRWNSCLGAVEPVAEQCNEKDDDCNGKIDDIPPRTCYTGPKESAGKGPCQKGIQACVKGQWEVTCTGEIKPAKDICDGKDKDCDGQIDNGCVSDFAGDGNPGGKNGPKATAQFQNPYAVLAVGQNTYLVADWNGLRKVGPGDSVTTLTSERYCSLITNSKGIVFGSKPSSHTIHTIRLDGTASLYAGVKNSSGKTNGPKGSATFNVPCGLAFDKSDNLYIADIDNFAIRKIDTQGQVSLFAGGNGKGTKDGSRTQAQFSFAYTPSGSLAFDSKGNLYVSDTASIRKISTQGAVTTFAGPTNSVVKFQRGIPGELLVEQSTEQLYFSNVDTHQVMRIDLKQTQLHIHAGSTQGYKNGPRKQAEFAKPRGIAFDAKGRLIVVDENNSRLRRISSP